MDLGLGIEERLHRPLFVGARRGHDLFDQVRVRAVPQIMEERGRERVARIEE